MQNEIILGFQIFVSSFRNIFESCIVLPSAGLNTTLPLVGRIATTLEIVEYIHTKKQHQEDK
jgi:hypothetical protein